MSQLDRRTWERITEAVNRQARRLRRIEGTLKRARYSDALIAKFYFWSVLHDRPIGWAADVDHVRSRLFRPRAMPSRSQLERRINMGRFTRLLGMIHRDLAGVLDPTDGGMLDGKPLTVSPVSKDAEALRGHITGGFAKGYKLHVWATSDRRIPLWSLMPLNEDERVVAEALIPWMPQFSHGALTMADGLYDSRRLYPALAARNGALLVRPRGMDLENPALWRKQQEDLHPKSRTGGPCRDEALLAWKHTPGLAAHVYKDRIHVEGTLSNLCCYGGGLGPLPAWVRTLRRVRRWVGTKIILYHARLLARRDLQAML
jgi:hypothetical protein